MSIPTDFSNLAVWLDAQDLSTITMDGSNRISQWADKSGNTNHAAQAGADAIKAIYSATGINNRPAVSFTGDQRLIIPDHASLDKSSASWFLVMQRTTNIANAQVIITKYGAGSPPREWQFLISNPADVFQFQASTTGAATDVSCTSTTVATEAVPFIVDARYDGAGVVSLKINDADESTDTDSAIVNGPNNITLGGGNGTANDLAGYIGEFIFFTSMLSSNDRLAILAYLRAKWLGNPYYAYRQQ